MTDATASLPPKFLPSQPPSGHAPGREDDSVRIAEDGPTFAEVLDMLNLLHHIPGISTIYRAITGDEIGAGPRFVGGMLFGGPIGALAAGITALFEEASGGDLGTHIAEMVDDFTGGSDPEAPAIAADTAAKAAAVVTAAGGGNAQIPQAALPAEHLAAQAHVFNRIALNPAAALGAPPPDHGIRGGPAYRPEHRPERTADCGRNKRRAPAERCKDFPSPSGKDRCTAGYGDPVWRHRPRPLRRSALPSPSHAASRRI